MNINKDEIVAHFIDNGAIRFGEFELKSKRLSPYFFDIGILDKADTLLKLGSYFAESILENFGTDFDIIFGPAYKGIPLSIATAIAFNVEHGINKGFLFNRKVEKDHAEGGHFVGNHPDEKASRMVMVDDVFTTGDTKYEMIDAIKSSFPGVKLLATLIGLDRLEKSNENENAIEQFTERTGIPVFSLVTAYDVLNYLDGKDAVNHDRIRTYLEMYGT